MPTERTEKLTPAKQAPPRPAPAPVPADVEEIRVRGARVHNLKNIDFTIPHNAITVVTGVSGSGKSSLAFDTLYAEGQRRYIESLSAYARQFLERIEKPDVDEITGIAPAISIRQKNSTRNPRSTVATATEIYDYLRLLYARAGHTFCLNCGEEVRKDTLDEIAARVLALPAGQRFYVLYELAFAPEPAAGTVQKDSAARPRKTARPSPDTIRLTLTNLAQARIQPALPGRARIRILRRRRTCSTWISRNRRTCSWTGSRCRLKSARAWWTRSRSAIGKAAAKPFYNLCRTIQPVRRPSRPIDSYSTNDSTARNAAPCIRSPNRGFSRSTIPTARVRAARDSATPSISISTAWCRTKGNRWPMARSSRGRSRGTSSSPWTCAGTRAPREFPFDVPFRDLTTAQRNAILDGDRKEDFPGVKGFFAWLERKKYKLHVRVFLSRYRGYALCPDCRGTRLRAEARAVKIAGRSITEVCQMTVKEARPFLDGLQLSPAETTIAEKVLEEIQQRLRFLDEVGLDYLTLDRLTSTLSGGEAQRIQLATSLGSHLVGALYVLDEPSIGLHPRDTGRLIEILKGLRDLGNTLLVVEHDPDTILAADTILDLGPGAGEHGGELIFAGTREELLASAQSLTGRYLRGELRIAVPPQRRKPQGRFLKIIGARSHNLQGVDVTIPLGMLVAVTGVSGSGKSTLVYDVIYKALEAKRAGGNWREFCDRIEGDAPILAVEMVDQSPIGRTPRSNPATYMKAFDSIRDLFASTPEAKKRGLGAGHFSFNIPGGRCEACQGDGTVTVEMRFLADVELVCEECRGTRYKSSVLEVRHRGKNIHDVLQMTVREALAFFAPYPKVTARLRLLDEVGLGYLRLGQSGTTLSGGEAQRLKLAAHLTRQDNSGILYIFDEPTTGLHFDDIQKLLTVVSEIARRRGFRADHRTQPRRDQISRLDDRSGTRGRRCRRQDCGRGNSRAGGAQFAVSYRQVSRARAERPQRRQPRKPSVIGEAQTAWRESLLSMK